MSENEPPQLGVHRIVMPEAATARGRLHTSVTCPHCGKRALLAGDYRGFEITCVFQACGKRISIEA
jgi:transcription elongation factor Elf1